MGNRNKKPMGRRIAATLGVLGALVMSSGVALMVTATPANAAQKVTFCHSTGSESNPWIKLTTDTSSFYHGHVLAQHTADIYPNVTFKQGKTTVTVPAQGDQAVLGNNCKPVGSEPGDLVASATVSFNDPTCASPSSGSISMSVDNGSFNVTPDTDDYTVGDVVSVDAVADQGAAFAAGDQTHWEHTFVASDAPCPTTTDVLPPTTTVVSPPKAKTPKAHTPKAAVSTPTVVHAGLAGVSAQDLRGEQGLALMVAGMFMLVAAGGLGLRLRGVASRI
jgi:hypothetical protein